MKVLRTITLSVFAIVIILQTCVHYRARTKCWELVDAQRQVIEAQKKAIMISAEYAFLSAKVGQDYNSVSNYIYNSYINRK